MMSKFNDLLNLRFKQKPAQPPKMTALVERTSSGELSSFSGIFRVTALSKNERSELEAILNSYLVNASDDIQSDLEHLSAITSEVKAIANQAVILHGERIKRAQDILKKYRDGAFTAWLFATYGNRQTPYNFLQYYEFYTAMPAPMHSLIDQMPRQAIYSLASRAGSMERKEAIVKNYCGQPKQELLKLIRLEFPLSEDDRRLTNLAANAVSLLKRARDTLENPLCVSYDKEKRQIKNLLAQIQLLIDK